LPLIAHRGFPEVYPENTLQGFKKAIESGAQYVELDVQLSADLQAVLYHDRDMQRVSEKTGAIHDYRLNELLSFKANEPQRYGNQFSEVKITTLSDFLKYLKTQTDIHAFIEIKRVTIEKFGIETVIDNIVPLLETVSDQITLISFSLDLIEQAKKYAWLRRGLILEQWANQDSLNFNELNIDIIFCNIKKCPANWRWKHSTPLALYDISEPQLADECFKRGASFIETFNIGHMQKNYQRKFNEQPTL
jgi:glycerophosphoryl diester phosphodiesterase